MILKQFLCLSRKIDGISLIWMSVYLYGYMISYCILLFGVFQSPKQIIFALRCAIPKCLVNIFGFLLSDLLIIPNLSSFFKSLTNPVLKYVKNKSSLKWERYTQWNFMSIKCTTLEVLFGKFLVKFLVKWKTLKWKLVINDKLLNLLQSIFQLLFNTMLVEEL